MSNQYTRASFAQALERLYHKDIREVLLDFQAKNYTYKDVSERFSYKETTVRKHFRRHQVVLKKSDCHYDDILATIRYHELTLANFLYKPWQSRYCQK